MSEMIVKSIHLKAPSDDPEDRRAPFIFSTNDIDRDGEVLEQNWRLDNFQKNPIALYAHDARSLPIGNAESVGVVDGNLQGTIVFASEKANPKAEQVFQLYKEKMLRTVSVGFVPHSYKWEMRNGEELLVFDDNELVEISIVPIPSNMNAVALAMKSIDEKRGFTVAKSHGFGEDKMAEEITKEESPDRVEVLEKAITEKDAQITEKDNKILALNQRCKDLEASRNEQQKRADDLTQIMVEKDLDSLVGKQITPAEKASLLKLANVSKDLFDEHLSAIKARPEMTLLKSVIPASEPTVSSVENSDRLASLSNRIAFGG